jgi:hypothetical protein
VATQIAACTALRLDSAPQQFRSVYHETSHTAGRRIALQVLDTFASCLIPDIARLGRTRGRGARG